MRRYAILLAFILLPLLSPGISHSKGDENLPLSFEEFLRRLKYDDFEILSIHSTQHGMTGATRWTVSFKGGPQNIDVKWKPAPPINGDAWNNSPRREIAAYKVQELFLDPPNYVVPPVASRCISMDAYSKIEPKSKPNLAGNFNCVYGVLSAWLKNVTLTHPVFDKKRFAADPRYAYHMANVNLLGYLIDHQDSVDDNFLISTVPGNPKVFSIDNGISFRWEFHNPFMRHFKKIKVPSLPKASIERLRKVTDADLEKLGVVEQLDPDSGGILRQVDPRENFRPAVGSRVRTETVQIGLTQVEIDNMKQRLKNLLKEVDKGKYPLF